jgi:hypothetical protein
MHNIMFSIVFITVMFGIYVLVSAGYVCPVISRVDDTTIVNRCTDDFGPRSSTDFHKGVDINRASGVDGDKIRNIHEETVTIDQTVARNATAGNYIRAKKSGTPDIYVRYLHMRNNYPDETNANRWVFLDDAQLDNNGGTADIIVQYQNNSISKVWGAVTGKAFGGVAVSTTLTNAEIFGRVGNTGDSTGPHLHIDINNEASTSSTHPPFNYVPRGTGSGISLTLVSPSSPGTLQRNVEQKFTYTVDSLATTNDTDLDFETATIAISSDGGQNWTDVNSFNVKNLNRTPVSGIFRDAAGKNRMKSNSNGNDEIYLYWQPTSSGSFKVRCSVFHANSGTAFATATGDYTVS